MVTVDDIFHHIAQDLRCYSGVDRKAAVEEFVAGSMIDLHIAITTDIEETELSFLERYGHGHTFYFRLGSYAHGKQLAGQMYGILYGVQPDMDRYTGEHFDAGDRLYLFLHITSMRPLPANYGFN